MQIWLVWTDLEEAVKAFTDSDGLCPGSRHRGPKVISQWHRFTGSWFFSARHDCRQGTRCGCRETGSKRWLQDFIQHAAEELGYGQYFFQYETDIIDDHVPFIRAGIPSVDVVDARYGRMGPQFDGMGGVSPQ